MARLRRLSIPTRIVLGFLVVLLAFGAVAVVSFVQHNRTAHTLEALEDGYLPLALTLGTAKATHAVYADLVERVLEDNQTTRTKKWLRAALRVRPSTLKRAYEDLERVETVSAGLGDPGSLAAVRRSLDGIGKAYETLDDQYEELFDALEAEQAAGVTKSASKGRDADSDAGGDVDSGAGDEPSANGAAQEGAEPEVEKTPTETALSRIHTTEQLVERRYQAAWTIAQQEISRVSKQAAERQRRSTMFLGLLGLLALVVGIAVTWLSQRVLRPIPLLHKRVADVAKGDLSSGALPVERDDELGQLVAEFERMVRAIAARDLKLREAALAERRLQRMQVQIVEALRAAVVVIGSDRVLRNINPAAERILGVHASDVGKDAAETSLFRRFGALETTLDEVASSGRAVFLQGERITGFNENLVDVLVTPFGDDAEGARGLLIVADDVTEAAVTKSRLIQTERLAAIGRMAAHVTHEVRNPLSSIGLNFDLLKDELQSADQESHALIGSIQQELDRLESITEEYLRLARLPQPSLTAEDPSDFLRSLASFVRPEMDAAGVTLVLDVGSRLPEVAMDDAQFRQALLNLLRNAREAMPDGGGTIKLNAIRYEGGVRIEVHDEGAGVDAEQRERVFDLFYTTKERGTGLGLPLTQQIVAAHGGTIECRNRLPHGTTFVIWLPAAGEARQGAPTRQAV